MKPDRCEIRAIRKQFKRWLTEHRATLNKHAQCSGDRILLDLDAILYNGDDAHPVFLLGLQESIAVLSAARGERMQENKDG
jgi:hypothetical protein